MAVAPQPRTLERMPVPSASSLVRSGHLPRMNRFACRRGGGGVRAVRRRHSPSPVALIVVLLACSRPVAGPAGVHHPLPVVIPPADSHDVTGKPELLLTDSPRVTASGVRYVAPAGWALVVRGGLIVLSAQDGDSHVAIVESTAAEADTAVAEAWALYRRTPPPRLKL